MYLTGILTNEQKQQKLELTLAKCLIFWVSLGHSPTKPSAGFVSNHRTISSMQPRKVNFHTKNFTPYAPIGLRLKPAILYPDSLVKAKQLNSK